MNSFSHIVIGRHLHRYIRERHGIELSLAGFLYGNLIPDYLPSYKRLPHTMEYWGNYLESEFGRLSALRHKTARFGMEYSKRLGIICHFYADFFCYAHTKEFTGGAYLHVLYEWALHRHLQEHLSALKEVDFTAGAGMRSGDAAGIRKRFKALQRQYLKEPASFSYDIAYTLRACIDAVATVAGNSVTNPGICIPSA